jgi:ABC-2 type transport system ATP-binding protein
MYQRVATLGRATPQAIALLKRSSPATVDSRIHAPTLLIQGEHDSLFGLSQANANYQQIRRAGTPVDMVWFAGGHDGGDQQTSRMEALTAQWFHRWLSPGHPPRSAPTGLPGFEVSRSLGFDPSTGQQSLGVATAAAYPGLAGADHVTVRLSGPPQIVVNPPGGSPASISVFPGLGQLGPAAGAGGPTFDMPGQSAAFTSAPLRAPLQVTGSPQVRIRVSGARQVTLFAKVYDVNQVGTALLPYQLVAPVRVSNATNGATVTIRLPAMDYAFAAGHRLRLVLTTTDFAYATPATPATYRVSLAGPGLTLPTDPALTIGGSPVPWWTWAAPTAALAAAIVLLMAGRRRGTERLSPRVAEVPLEITGLTKRYRDGQLAVDDLSLRVERGQILGLLGPNGAGKTTTLRALMGLLHPDAGTITIFGREVSPGSPALSRLGSFVEGPGFLPHLSGRANLDLYWQSTGRPIGDARMAEVLAVAGLGEAIDRRVRTYSRGMCQRLAIAQAMLGFPDLLVLDEPMNGLDPPQIHEMRDVLRDYAVDGRTVILSSHLLAEVELTCTHVVVMNQGRWVAAGPVQAIIGEGAALAIGTPEAGRALSVLETVPGIAGAEPAPGGIIVHAGEVRTADVVAVLVRAGVPVERVGPGRRLEDAFLALIGSDGVTAPAAAASRSPAGQGASMDGGS